MHQECAHTGAARCLATRVRGERGAELVSIFVDLSVFVWLPGNRIRPRYHACERVRESGLRLIVECGRYRLKSFTSAAVGFDLALPGGRADHVEARCESEQDSNAGSD